MCGADEAETVRCSTFSNRVCEAEVGTEGVEVVPEYGDDDKAASSGSKAAQSSSGGASGSASGSASSPAGSDSASSSVDEPPRDCGEHGIEFSTEPFECLCFAGYSGPNCEVEDAEVASDSQDPPPVCSSCSDGTSGGCMALPGRVCFPRDFDGQCSGGTVACAPVASAQIETTGVLVNVVLSGVTLADLSEAVLTSLIAAVADAAGVSPDAVVITAVEAVSARARQLQSSGSSRLQMFVDVAEDATDADVANVAVAVAAAAHGGTLTQALRDAGLEFGDVVVPTTADLVVVGPSSLQLRGITGSGSTGGGGTGVSAQAAQEGLADVGAQPGSGSSQFVVVVAGFFVVVGILCGSAYVVRRRRSSPKIRSSDKVVEMQPQPHREAVVVDTAVSAEDVQAGGRTFEHVHSSHGSRVSPRTPERFTPQRSFKVSPSLVKSGAFPGSVNNVEDDMDMDLGMDVSEVEEEHTAFGSPAPVGDGDATEDAQLDFSGAAKGESESRPATAASLGSGRVKGAWGDE